MMDDPPKRFDNFVVTDTIGRGGMGVVYRARYAGSEREAAIKVLAGHLATNRDYVKRFLREGRITANLRHRNIVRVFTAGIEHGRPWLALEYIRGKSLAEFMDERVRLDPEEAVAIARQIAAGLEAAHAEGVIHRDLKPGNIMVDEFGTIKIMDFGLAKPVDASTDLTATGIVLGTP